MLEGKLAAPNVGEVMEGKIYHGSAPGRLDFMGGVADYSGSLVLQIPIAAKTEVSVRTLDQPILRFTSANSDEFAAGELPLSAEFLRCEDYAEYASALDRSGAPRWIHYVAGCLAVLVKEKGARISSGLAFEVRSQVPHAAGVSSSAALEVATLRALADFLDVRFSGTELARLGQIAENRVVGAPCGLMDQLASAYGRQDAVLPILCRPDILSEPVDLPGSATVVGWPSGVRHDVGASPYGIARTATFMGKKIFEQYVGQEWSHASQISPAEFGDVGVSALPATMKGKDFINRFGGVDDPLSEIDPETDYPVRPGLAFPIEENARCGRALALLEEARGGDAPSALREIGQRLLQSHQGYTSIGLGHRQTDIMVEALVSAGPERGIYGGRASGGGSGGTVAVLLEREALPVLEQLKEQVGLKDRGALPLIRAGQ
jgi:L-arabinokinase